MAKPSIFFLALICLFLSFVAFADEGSACHECWAHRHSNLSLSVSPQYYSLNSDSYSAAFANNGLNSPKSGAIGLDFLLFGTSESNWQMGPGFGMVSIGSDFGSNTAQFSQQYLGLWIAKKFDLSEIWEVSLGSMFSYGFAQFEILSSNANGRTSESSFLIQPKLTTDFRISNWVKLGASVSYLEPLISGDTVNGQNLTPGNISIHGLKAGIELILGRFGPDESSKTKE